jgi:hypothetical protein
MNMNHISACNRIITHDDFDGVLCAVICSYALNVDDIQFAAPRMITEARISITKQDIVCDLPYPLECGMWFDHHEGNFEEVRYRGIDPQSIRGRFSPQKSCARVVFEYFQEQKSLPLHFAPMVDEADVIDSFSYSSIEEWRRETPGKVIDCALKLPETSVNLKWDFSRHIISLLKETPIAVAASRSDVRERYEKFQAEEQNMLRQLEQHISFLPDDPTHRLMILDLTPLNRQPSILKHLSFLLHPESEGIIEIRNLFKAGTKTNDLSISMSLSLNLKNDQHHKNVGDIMRQLNIGSGHRGAGAGIIHCHSKREMLTKKEETVREILSLYDKGESPSENQ